MKDRGFKKLVGKTIKEVRVDAINCVSILCEDGTHFTIDADEHHYGIAMPLLTKGKGKLEKLPKLAKAKKVETMQISSPHAFDVDSAWPFPKAEDFKV